MGSLALRLAMTPVRGMPSIVSSLVPPALVSGSVFMTPNHVTGTKEDLFIKST